MLDKILNFKNYIIVAALAFALGGGIMGGAAYKLTANYKDAQQVAALAQQKGEHDAAVAETEKITRQLNKYQGDTIVQLMAEKANLEGVKNEKVRVLESKIATLLERNKHGSGGVLRDHRASPPPVCPVGPAGVAGPAQADPADTGRLSREASEDLLNYARDAEITRLDLITQHEYSNSVTQKYNELVRKVREAQQSDH